MKLVNKGGVVKEVPAELVKDYLGTKEWEVWAGEPAVDSKRVGSGSTGKPAKKARTAKKRV